MTTRTTFDPLILSRSIAYCKGFVHGYEEGVDMNPYDGESEAHSRNQYRIGYDAGVAEYCNATHPEE